MVNIVKCDLCKVRKDGSVEPLRREFSDDEVKKVCAYISSLPAGEWKLFTTSDIPRHQVVKFIKAALYHPHFRTVNVWSSELTTSDLREILPHLLNNKSLKHLFMNNDSWAIEDMGPDWKNTLRLLHDVVMRNDTLERVDIACDWDITRHHPQEWCLIEQIWAKGYANRK